MSAEVKRVERGIYLLFLGETVTDEDVFTRLERCQQAVEMDKTTSPIMIVDPIQITNPLGAARFIAKHTPLSFTHYVIVGATVGGKVLAERLQRALTDVCIEVAQHQPAAIEHAKAVRGTSGQPITLSCDYL